MELSEGWRGCDRLQGRRRSGWLSFEPFPLQRGLALRSESTTPLSGFVDLIVRPPFLLRLGALAIALAVAAGLFVQGSRSYAVGAIPPVWDKLAHAAVFGGLAGLAWIASGGGGWRARIGAGGFALAVGALDETFQASLPGRNPSVLDLAADAAGATVVVALLVLLAARRGASQASAGSAADNP